MSVTRTAALAAVLLGAAAPLAPVQASCVGSQTTARACLYPENVSVEPTGGAGFHDCVSLGNPDDCVPVDVSTPTVMIDGEVFEYECYACDDAGPLVADALEKAQPVLDRAFELADRATRMECAPGTTRAGEESYDLQTVAENVRRFVASCV